MGADLAEGSAAARKIFDAASETAGFDVLAACRDSSPEELSRTELSQIAIFTHSLAALAALEERGVAFEAAAGFSLGEYTALTASGVLTLADGLKLVRRRGQLMQAAARHMAEHGVRGSLINITSTRGERAYPGDSVYGGLKAGLNRAVQSIALDLAPYGIRVNNVAPGAVRVRSNAEAAAAGFAGFWDKLGERIPLGRSGEPGDVGEAVAFLASDRASYITGTTLRVDGGLILPGMPENPSAAGWGAEPVRPEKKEE